jgi:hypothetical protein
VIARILRPEEWHRINTPDLPPLVPFVEPENLAVVVVEDDAGEIIACVSAMRVTHFEGLWIKPEYRGNAGVFRALIRQAYAVPRVRGEAWVFGSSAHGNDRMERMCGRLGGRELPVRFYAMPVGGS